jgi:hypothetical protein
MKVKDVIARAQKHISIKNVLIKNVNMETLLYFGPISTIPTQFLNKEVTCYLYNASRELFILKITT